MRTFSSIYSDRLPPGCHWLLTTNLTCWRKQPSRHLPEVFMFPVIYPWPDVLSDISLPLLSHYILLGNCWNKRLRKPKGQSRIDNPETLATLATQDTGRRQSRDTGNIGYTRHKTKSNTHTHTHTKTQHKNIKRLATRTPPNPGVFTKGEKSP